MRNKIILITGGAGFIGSNIAIFFKTHFEKIKVICFDNLKRNGSSINVPRLKKHGIEFIHGDVRNKEDLESVGKFHILIECSAEPSVSAGLNDSPLYVINTNLIGTINCLEVARKQLANFIFLSTSRVYPIKDLQQIKLKEHAKRYNISDNQIATGVSKQGISENFPLHNHRSIYGSTKLASELLIKEYINLYNIKGVINRCGVVAGPWQMGKVDQGVISLWIANHVYKKPLKYIGFDGSGKQVRDVLHVHDLCELILLQLKNKKKFNGKTYNVGGGPSNSISLLELTSLCEQVSKSKTIISSIKKTKDYDIPIYITDNTKISTESGWQPKRCVKTIVEDIYQWIIDNKKQLSSIFN